MTNILCRTKGNANPKGKPRVYFTCHPEDFDRYFDKICEDIFKTHDCAIFYTEDMSAAIEEQDKATDLESNNLFVVPVTFRLLSQPNRAMDADIPFAFEKHIPVLPFMMEPSIDSFYSRPDKFGELQYLNPYSTDLTEVSYEAKLKKYLESVLISDEMAKRVRAAFDAYIFLSYRKKDRRYANELMRLIHSHPECRDIAIWFDEFLTPGESFKTNIEKALENSKLFALLVTPCLLEEPEGKPNFVMGEEYPAAQKSGIDILPAEMEVTDKAALAEKYPNIPPCVDPHDEVFKSRLLESISKIAITTNDDDSMHNFLIGLAYLDGIDVEVDKRRGMASISSAAEQDLPEAMEKLYNMYCDGAGVTLDYRQAAKWANRLAEYYQNLYGEESEDAILWTHTLALAHHLAGDYKQALDLNKKVHSIRCRVSGEEHPDTLLSLNNLAMAYSNLGDYTMARELLEKAYTGYCDVLGEEHPDTLVPLGNLTLIYDKLGNYEKTKALAEQAYAIRSRVLGEAHPDALLSLNNLAMAYGNLGDYTMARELLDKAYARYCVALGEDHPDTLVPLGNLAMAYDNLGNYAMARELHEKAYALRCQALGEEHPKTLFALNNLSMAYSHLGEHEKALALAEQAYALRCRILGETHPDTLVSTINLAYCYMKTNDYNKALSIYQEGYPLLQKIFGEAHLYTQTALSNIRSIYRNMGLCQYCGGKLKGVLRKKCSKCCKPKDY